MKESKLEKKMVGQRKVLVPITLIAIIMFHLINNYIWLKLDNTYLLYDSHWHFLFSLRVFDEIKNHFLPILSNIFADFIYHRWHGIFVAYVTAPFYFIFGTSQDAGVMINSAIFLSALVFSTYGIGKVLFDRKSGILAAFILTMYPLIFNHLRIYMLDLPLTAIITLSIYLLLLTDNFTKKKYSFLFAISVGLGMLTKFSFAGFIAGPLFLTLYRAFISNQREKNIRMIQKKNLLIVFFIIVAISFAFYKLKFWEVLARIYGCSWLYAIRYYPNYSFLSLIHRWLTAGKDFLFWCIEDMINNSLSFLFFFLFIVSLPTFIRKKINNKNILYLWVFLPLLFLSLLFHYPDINRYIMPIMPAMAIISGIGIINIKYIKARQIIILLILLLGCFQYFAISYNIGFIPERLAISSSNKIFLFNRIFGSNYRNKLQASPSPSRVNWKSEAILNEIMKTSGNSKHKISIFFISAIPHIYEPIAYLAFLKKLPIIINVVSLAEEGSYKDTASTIYMITMSDYVVMRKEEKFNIEFPPFVKTRIQEARELLGRSISDFNLMREFKLEDDSTLFLFKRKEDYKKIGRGPLELYFRAGVTKLYCNNEEVTRDLGLETLFDYDGKQYSSAQAIWNVENIGYDKIIATARWDDLPFYQKWEFQFHNSKSLSWRVIMRAPGKTEIKNRVSALVLSEKYKEWLSGGVRNKFSNENIFLFKKIVLPESKSYIGVSGVKKNKLPKILFQPEANQFKIIPIIKWRKNLRIIEFIAKDMANGSLLPVGDFNFFSGNIIIGEDNI